MPLHSKILLGLVLGATAGAAFNIGTGGGAAVERLVSMVFEPIGRVWLNALIMVVIPLITSTLAVGVVGLGSLQRLGRIGLVTFACFLGLTLVAAILGLMLVNLIQPGTGLSPDVRARLMNVYQGAASGAMGLAQGGFGLNTFVQIVPRNPVQAAANGEMLAVIFFALMLGIGLTKLPPKRALPLLSFLESLGHVTVAIIDIVMRAAPVAVFCLIFSVTARFGFDILLNLLKYVVTVIGGLAIFMVVGYSIALKFVARRSPAEFFRRVRLVMVTAFCTSSSNATLPTTIRVSEEELGISREVAGFVLPLGATMNMNGTALFEGVTVLFVAQVFGIDLSLGTQIIVVIMSVITAIGTAGIPGGSIPLLMMVLQMVGAPAEGIAIVLGVDRILDMCRTTLNVTGDVVTATIVARMERGRPAVAETPALQVG